MLLAQTYIASKEPDLAIKSSTSLWRERRRSLRSYCLPTCRSDKRVFPPPEMPMRACSHWLPNNAVALNNLAVIYLRPK